MFSIRIYEFSDWSARIDGGGWELVRRVKRGSTWHPATDSLEGSDVYGTMGHEVSDTTFSVRFNTTQFNQFLFATGKFLFFWFYIITKLVFITLISVNVERQKFYDYH